MTSLAKYALANGGSIHPLIIPAKYTQGTGIMNPSIFNDNGKIIGLIRNVNYTFYHSEKKIFQHAWGPLTYVHPEHDMHLRTVNYYCEFDNNLNIVRVDKIDTSNFDNYEPQWDFVGLEDARIFRWNNKLYTSGVRRDLDKIGTGRMELCEIVVTENSVKEISRNRIAPPNDPNSYCEKNWMPILDRPYHYVKWSNPTEVVEVNLQNNTSRTVSLSESISLPRDLRGGSQVIKIGNFYLSCTHEVELFSSEVGRKDAIYHHRFILWDSNFNIVHTSKEFNFMDGHVEFCVGMCLYENDILLSFGFQDNVAYLLRVPQKILEQFVNL